MVKSLNRPKDNAAGIPAKKMHIPVIHVVFFRFVLSPLVRAATMISTIEKADVNVANKNNTKNTNKKKLPKGIWLNTAGRTTNNKPGPSVGSKPNWKKAGNMARPARIQILRVTNTSAKTKNKNKLPKRLRQNTARKKTNNNPGPTVGTKPNANTAGNMANPAKIYIMIFMDTTVNADFDKSSFLDKDELYVTITETPTLMEKKDCPKANRIVSEFRPEKSGFRKKDKPSPI